MSPLILGLGGTTRPGSSSETALRIALREAERLGARTQMLTGRALDLPHDAPSDPSRTPEAQRLVAALRQADGVIVSSPAYHGGPSGMIENAFDDAEDMREDARPYLDGRAVGLIVAACCVQAMGTTLSSLGSVVQALRGWRTPMGVALNGLEKPFAGEEPATEALGAQFVTLARQVTAFVGWLSPHEEDPAPGRAAG